MVCILSGLFYGYVEGLDSGQTSNKINGDDDDEILYSALIWRGLILANLQSRNLAEF